MQNASTWLIRHGQSTSNAGIWSDKPHEVSLTELGKQQAILCAEQISQQPDLIVTSPATRAIETSLPIRERWPAVAHEIWPIQELVYLSPTWFVTASPAAKKAAIASYWSKCDPYFSHEGAAESFADFLNRVRTFDEALKKQNGLTVVVGHGQFLQAYLLGLKKGFQTTRAWMQEFRQSDEKRPIKNGEIIKL